ncbi:DUF2127 domain-containing protein [Pedosphaera parvula]|uniref:Membrane protein-like protein n=1 Tax=Pedosphaera parvula (strain Ellin514) TaxID=320771 RepID=B9XD77_PEDPL|nr:DUF2127 domain-containing protein [Pedosphaera parvula]EEF62023.1 membrane protein-like protein [Pedosphaera parvula Ellin514]
MKQKTGLHHYFGLRAVAIFEFAKGFLVLAAGLGLLSLIHRDAQEAAEKIVRVLHFNPANHYPHVFIQAAGNASDARLWFYASAALAYAMIRIAEGYGLWYEKRWAEWFAAISAGLYIPVELYHLWHRVTWLKAVVLISNVLIVIYLVMILLDNHRQRVAATRKIKTGSIPIA